MDPGSAELWKYASTLGVGGVIAVIIYIFSRKELKSLQDKLDEQCKVHEEKLEIFMNQWKGQTEILINLVKENSVSWSTNTQVMQALHRRIDQGTINIAERRQFKEEKK